MVRQADQKIVEIFKPVWVLPLRLQDTVAVPRCRGWRCSRPRSKPDSRLPHRRRVPPTQLRSCNQGPPVAELQVSAEWSNRGMPSLTAQNERCPISHGLPRRTRPWGTAAGATAVAPAGTLVPVGLVEAAELHEGEAGQVEPGVDSPHRVELVVGREVVVVHHLAAPSKLSSRRSATCRPDAGICVRWPWLTDLTAGLLAGGLVLRLTVTAN
jgi:hypothetical protein